MIVVNLLFAAGQVALFALAWKPVEGVGTGARGLFLASFILGAASLLARAAAPLASPDSIDAFVAPSAIQAFGLMTAYTTILLSSVSFLLMQKERADFVAGQLASLDPLTGAFNRRTFIELAGKELSRARRLEAPVSLVLLDIDHFKRVNDTHGHLAGDQVLRRFAEVVRDQLRREDIFVRYGGEEFCLLLPDVAGTGCGGPGGTHPPRGDQGRVRRGRRGDRAHRERGRGGPPRRGPGGVEALIARADEALYIAKNRGRNRVAAVSLGRTRAA